MIAGTSLFIYLLVTAVRIINVSASVRGTLHAGLPGHRAKVWGEMKKNRKKELENNPLSLAFSFVF